MTSEQRYSAMNISCPWRGLNVVPQVVSTAGERFAVMFYYDLTGAPPSGSTVSDVDSGILVGAMKAGSGGIQVGSWGM